MKEWLIRILVGIAVAVIVIIGVTWVASGDLANPANREIGRPPLDLEASNITFASGAGVLIHGWFVPGKDGQGIVLLLHTVRGDRRDMISRARFLKAQGHTVLMIDFQANGMNRGKRITFGDLESRDVVGALQYLHYKRPTEKVAVIGVQMGADAYVLADNRPKVDAVVLEQMYPTINRAVASRVRPFLGPFAAVIGPLMMEEMQSRSGIAQNRLRPIDHLSKVGAPVLIVNGTDDKHITIDEAREELAAAPPPRELWAVEGAGHEDLHAFAKKEYERRLGDFLAKYLRSEAGAGVQSETAAAR
jgi:esterase/lipase